VTRAEKKVGQLVVCLAECLVASTVALKVVPSVASTGVTRAVLWVF